MATEEWRLELARKSREAVDLVNGDEGKTVLDAQNNEEKLLKENAARQSANAAAQKKNQWRKEEGEANMGASDAKSDDEALKTTVSTDNAVKKAKVQRQKEEEAERKRKADEAERQRKEWEKGGGPESEESIKHLVGGDGAEGAVQHFTHGKFGTAVEQLNSTAKNLQKNHSTDALDIVAEALRNVNKSLGMIG